MKFNIILFIGLLFFNDVSGQVVRLSCVDTPLQADLDLERVSSLNLVFIFLGKTALINRFAVLVQMIKSYYRYY